MNKHIFELIVYVLRFNETWLNSQEILGTYDVHLLTSIETWILRQ